VFSWRLVSDGRSMRAALGRNGAPRSIRTSTHTCSCGEWASDYANRADITSRQRACPAVLNGALSYIIHQRRYLRQPPTHESRPRAPIQPVFFLIPNVSDANCAFVCVIIIIFPEWRMHVRWIVFPNAISCREYNMLYYILRFLSARTDL
jgi:hypothetical protein